MNRRIDIRLILGDPREREDLLCRVTMAIQATEGVETSYEQARRAYRKIRAERVKHKQDDN